MVAAHTNLSDPVILRLWTIVAQYSGSKLRIFPLYLFPDFLGDSLGNSFVFGSRSPGSSCLDLCREFGFLVLYLFPEMQSYFSAVVLSGVENFSPLATKRCRFNKPGTTQKYLPWQLPMVPGNFRLLRSSTNATGFILFLTTQ